MKVCKVHAEEWQRVVGGLIDWQHGHDNFRALLFGLIAKADRDNIGKLAMAFPAEVTAYVSWLSAPNPKEWLIEQGVPAEQLTWMDEKGL